MDLFSVLSLVGGLALFLYGMNLMSVGLTRLSGSKLQSILESLTSNRMKGVVLGAGITAIIQSSSATTVMLVGLVNAGIIRLRNAIPVIMGANIGTTITAWILSLVGIESSNLLVRMLNPESFTPIMAIVGVIFIMFTQNEKKHNIARILLGFAILMYGMDSMSASVSPLAEVEAFRNLFLLFSNPIVGVLVGAVLTAIIQSSSASVGILQALARTGLVSYGAAIPIIMGQNIGTTVTALISSVGANRNARRVAIFHLSFNVIGTCVFLTGFYALNAVLRFSFLSDEIAPVGIAIIHSIFNIFGTIMFLPFVGLLEKLTHKLVPDAEEDRIASQLEERFKLLEERFLETPALAVEQVKKLGSDMIDKTLQGLYVSLAMLDEYSHEGFVEVTALEGLVDRYEDRLGTYMIKLSARELTEYEYKTIAIWLHNISELERISDHSIHLVHAAAEMHERKIRFSDNARAELAVYKAALIKCIELAVTALREDDIDIAVQVEPLEEVIDRLNDELTARHIARLTNGECTLELGFIFSDLATSMERVADHCSNIAVSMIEIHADGLNTHEYLAQVKQDGTGFRKMYESYREEFRLPRDTRVRGNEATVSLPDNCPIHPFEDIETEA